MHWLPFGSTTIRGGLAKGKRSTMSATLSYFCIILEKVGSDALSRSGAPGRVAGRLPEPDAQLPAKGPASRRAALGDHGYP